MTIEQFINANRPELIACISKELGHVPKQAGCYCPLKGTEHWHETDSALLHDDELELWIANDEGLYLWAQREGVTDDEEGL